MKIKKILLLLIVVSFTTTVAQTNLSTIDQQVNTLLKKMTIEEKIGQMIQVDFGAVTNSPDDLATYNIGSVLWGGNSDPVTNSESDWAAIAHATQLYSEKTRLKIPMILGIDAVHGHNNVDGAVIFPHNIGLGATGNTDLLKKIGVVTAEEIQATGIQWDFAPCIAVVRDERWGRTYEGYGESPELVSKLGAAFIEGMQGDGITAACAKHYIGDGGTTNGKDQGNTECDEKTLRELYLPPYRAAIAAGVKTIMASYSSWNGEKMHGNKYLLTDVLKKELKFDGFIISDYAAIDQLPGTYKEEVEASINAGVDMVMIPAGKGRKNNFIEFATDLQELVNEKKVSMERINDAVRRILKVKYEIGLFTHRFGKPSLQAQFGSAQHREVARDAVRQSLVLLKNDKNVLPLAKNARTLAVVGKAADDMNMQCGGWTLRWQGDNKTPISGGTTILQAIRKAVSPETNVIFSPDGRDVQNADAVIVVVGEPPYAEGSGDRDVLALSLEDELLIKSFGYQNMPVVVILLSGRPLIVNTVLEHTNAFVAAWLPGTEGEGVADVLFGDFSPVGKLPCSWPASMQQIPINVGDSNYAPLFPFGFGLTYAK